MNKTAVAAGLSRMPLVWLAFGLLFACLQVRASGLDRDLRFQRILEGSEAIKKNASALTAILQDQTGFMWFGGENGLARFDGGQFKHYEHGDHPGALPSNYVRDLASDAQGVMWVATDRGLCRYFPETDRFEVFKPDYSTVNSLPHNVVTSIAVDRHDRLILGTGDGISILERDRRNFVNHTLTAEGAPLTFVLDTFVDSKNRIWVGTRDAGLFLLTGSGEVIRHFRADQSDPSALQSDTIKTIEEDQFGRIWVGTHGGGVSRIEEGERSFVSYLNQPQRTGSIASNTIWDIYLDSDDELWFSTDQGGLALYQPISDSFVHFRSSMHDRFTLSSNQVRTIYEDRDDNLWIVTFPNGINFFDRAHSQVTNYVYKPGDANSLSNSAVLNFLQTSDDILWIGTEDGLNQFDIQEQKFIGRYQREPDNDRSLTANSVLSLEEDFNGDIWVGTWSGGLHRFNRITQTFTHYGPNKSVKNYINSAFIWDIFLDSQNTLWIGTENGGLNRYNRSNDSFTAFTHSQSDSQSIASNFVWSMLEDSRGNFWVATADGLDILDRASESFRHFVKESDNPKTIDSVRIRSLFEDRNGRVWVGTQDKGAYFYEPETETFAHVPWPGSLSPLVTSFIEDNVNFIWASTANGIARIDPETLEVRSFHKSHGLVGDNFNRDATFKDRRGQLYFGGTEGFSVFDPRVFSRSDDDYPLVLTDFKLFNRSVAPSAEDAPLQRAITYADHIHLRPTHAMFSFNFSVLNYHSPFEHRYAYTLEGFDKQWYEAGTNHTATYTNIGPGNYTFKVKSSDRDGVWNPNIAQVKLTMAPSLWRSIWAMASYTILLMLVIGFSLNAFFRYTKHKREKLGSAENMRALRAPIGSMVDLAEAVLHEQSGCLPGNTEQRLEMIVNHGKRSIGLLDGALDYDHFSEWKPGFDSYLADVSSQTQAAGAAQTAVARTDAKSEAAVAGDKLMPPDNAAQYRILIVDDDPINRMVLSGILGLHHYTVLEAGSGPEALNRILHEGQRIDVIILDVMMPRMSGFEVCARLRQQYSKEALPIVFLTAKYGEEDVRKGLQAGGDEVLYKPVSKEVLLPRIKAYLLALDTHRKGQRPS